jgi:hypothetical protein
VKIRRRGIMMKAMARLAWLPTNLATYNRKRGVTIAPPAGCRMWVIARGQVLSW